MTTVDQVQTEFCERSVLGVLIRGDLDVDTLSSLILRWEELGAACLQHLTRNRTVSEKWIATLILTVGGGVDRGRRGQRRCLLTAMRQWMNEDY